MRILRRFSSSQRKSIIEEWRQNKKINQPMPDPDGVARNPRLSEIIMQPPMNHIRAMRDAAVLYRKTLFNPEEALREASIDDEFIKRATEKWSGRNKSGEEGTITVMEKKDMDEIMQKVKAMYPEGLPKDLSGTIKEIGNRKEDIKDVAIDRLEVMAEAINEFMSGYREGKDESRNEVEKMSDEEAKTYLANLVNNVDNQVDDAEGRAEDRK